VWRARVSISRRAERSGAERRGASRRRAARRGVRSLSLSLYLCPGRAGKRWGSLAAFNPSLSRWYSASSRAVPLQQLGGARASFIVVSVPSASLPLSLSSRSVDTRNRWSANRNPIRSTIHSSFRFHPNAGLPPFASPPLAPIPLSSGHRVIVPACDSPTTIVSCYVSTNVIAGYLRFVDASFIICGSIQLQIWLQYLKHLFLRNQHWLIRSLARDYWINNYTFE